VIPADATLDQRATSAGTLLGGRLAYAQFLDGYRTGIEPVLLAAAIPAVAGDRVVEGGTGAGAGLLCLASRVPGLTGLGLEIDPALAGLAAANVAANGHAGLHIQEQDVSVWRSQDMFDHAFANPPWHRADGTASPNTGRQLAKVAGATLLADWTRALAAPLRRRGTLSLLLPAAALADGVAALQLAGCPEIHTLPLWPRAGEPARLIILRGIRHGGGPALLHHGLVLHGPDGRFTQAADAILRHAASL
jgi:tRNA1(Val) A37 N6-methylase TrmN6